MKIIFFGDIVGKSGRMAVKRFLPELRQQYKPDLVIANIENIAHGKGVTYKTVSELDETGVDFYTSGNHVFSKPAVAEVFEKYGDRFIRPANFVGDFSGDGWKVIEKNGKKAVIINLNGRVFMESQFDQGGIDNPFTVLNKILSEIDEDVVVRIIDFHAEATSEKRAMGFFADGRVSAVLGTHTHVQSADSQILSKGTGYITDLGMTGARDSVIGVQKESVIERFLAVDEKQSGVALQIDESDSVESGFCVLEIDESTGKCQNIKRELAYD